MRMFVPLVFLMAAACSVDSDSRNDQVTVEFNDVRIDNAVDAAANEVGRVASDVGNSVEKAGRRLDNEIGDIDVDVDVRRNENRNSN